jgi:O-antigen ligase
LLLPTVAIFDYGRLLPLRLGLIRTVAFGAAILFLWRRRARPQAIGAYTMVVLGFVLLALGHAFSSVYPWVSFQHAVNMSAAAVLLAWAFVLFREDPAGMWEKTTLWIWGMGAAQLAIAVWQRVALGNLRPNGTFDNTNFLAEFLAVAALLCLARSFRPGMAAGNRFAAVFSAVAFFAGALSLAASRGVLLASAPAIAILLVSRFGWRRGGAVVLFGTFPVLTALGAGAARRFFEPDPNSYSRLLVWKSAFLTFLENPFGVGLGGFKHLWFSKQFPVEGAFLRYGNSAVYAHNEYLDVLVGLGAFGLLLFLAVLLYPPVVAAMSWRFVAEDRKGIVAATGSALMVPGLHAAFDFNFHEIGLVCAAATLTGGLLASLPERPARYAWTVPRWSMPVAALAVVALLVVSVATMAGGVAIRSGELRFREGNLEKASSSYRFAARVDPFRAETLDVLSLVRYRQFQGEAKRGGEPSVASVLLSEAISWEAAAMERSPRDYRFPSRLAQLLGDRYRRFGSREDLEKAFSMAGESIAMNPYSPALLLQRADLFLVGERAGEAKEDLLRAVSLEPNFCRGYARLYEISTRFDPEKSVMWGDKAAACRERAGRFPLKENERWAADLEDAK